MVKKFTERRLDVEMLMKLIAAALVAWGVASAATADEARSTSHCRCRHEAVGDRVVPGEVGTLRVKFVPGQTDALVRLKPAEAAWNFDAAAAVLVDVRNCGEKPEAFSDDSTTRNGAAARQWCGRGRPRPCVYGVTSPNGFGCRFRTCSAGPGA